MNRTEQLKKLLEIKEAKGNVTLRPLDEFAISFNMPHKKDAEIGRRILKKIFIKIN